MFAFEKAFGVPAGHTLREVASAPLARPSMAGGWRWEHEEYDARGALVAVYESWACGGGEAAPPGSGHRGGFVKYSPHGWVLRRSAFRRGSSPNARVKAPPPRAARGGVAPDGARLARHGTRRLASAPSRCWAAPHDPSRPRGQASGSRPLRRSSAATARVSSGVA